MGCLEWLSATRHAPKKRGFARTSPEEVSLQHGSRIGVRSAETVPKDCEEKAAEGEPARRCTGPRLQPRFDDLI